MNRTQKGSISVEAIVMLGIIAAMTPILYKHVADRREDMDNITEANTLLLLKNAAAEYIEANKDTLPVGTRLIDPTDIGIDISGYQIGIKKEANGTINAMVASTSGSNDMKAAKIASLLGVSAGIYSAQDSSKAWGINGIWTENISSYGFTSLPTGIPVVTTTYDKETETGLNEEELKEFIENNTFTKFSATELYSDKICLNGTCIAQWEDASYNPIQTIIFCNGGNNKECKRGFENNLNTSCTTIAKTYKENGGKAPTDFYTLTTSESSVLYEQPCVFTNGNIATETEVINQCNDSNNAQSASCRYGWINDINRSCNSIINIDSSRDKTVNLVTTDTSGSLIFCGFCEAPQKGECAVLGNNEIWVRSTEAKTYTQAETFCSNLGMELKSMASIQNAGLWGNGSFNPFSISQWHWSTDLYNSTNSTAWILNLGSNISGYIGRAYNGTDPGWGGAVYALCGPNPCDAFASMSGMECRSINGKPWVRSTSSKTYWNSETFCKNLGLELKSRNAIQEAGLWNKGSNPFSVTYWHWTTDMENSSDRGWLVGLGTNDMGPAYRDYNNWNYNDNTVQLYALCGPK